ncbi:MAG: prolyl oligopeptidase family serine peptidase, partial [Oligoflexales bacterium]|nr:prolyl oligopeptidase family serine peptidase [Oligoflexales bacterium]
MSYFDSSRFLSNMFRSMALLIMLAWPFMSYAEVPRDGELQGIVTRRVSINSFDGVRLGLILVMPRAVEPDRKLPAVVLPSLWGQPGESYFLQMRRLAGRGFIVASYSTRGFGFSEGTVDVGGPNDVGDVSSVIDWLISNYSVDENNIGVAGVSYGAGISILAAGHDRRIKTAVSMSGWTDLKRGLYENNSPKRVWGNILLIVGKFSRNLDRRMEQLFEKIKNQTATREEVDSYTGPRSAINIIDKYNERNVPVYFIHHTNDQLFTPNQILDFYSRLKGPKKLDLEPGIHVTPEILGNLGFPTTAWDNTIRWMEYWLRGRDTSAGSGMRLSGVSIAVKLSNEKIIFPEWPARSIDRSALYFGSRREEPYGSLTESFPFFDVEYVDTFKNSGMTFAESGIPVLSTILESHLKIPVYSNIYLMNRNTTLAYRSSPQSEDRLIVGAPAISAWVKPSAKNSQIVAYLYEESSNGILKLITHGPYTMLGCEPDVPFYLRFNMDFAAYRVKKGSRIVLVFDGSDSLYSTPVEKDYSVSIIF